MIRTKIFAKRIAEFALSKKASDVIVMDLRSVTDVADYFVVCSADSDTQVKAIADEVDEKLLAAGIRCFHKEGYETMNWILLDYFDVVVHVFRTEARNYYNLEKLWGDAPVIKIENDQ